MSQIDTLVSLTKGKKIILFGEVHGTKEIPRLLTRFFKKISKKRIFNIAMEIPENCQENIDKKILEGGKNDLEECSFFRKKEKSDGRNSKEYGDFVKSIATINKKRKEKIRIYCIEENTFNKNAQERKERNLEMRIRKHAKERSLYVILGEVHAAKKTINFNGVKIVPAGFLLSKNEKSIACIRIAAKRGIFFNEKEQRVGDTSRWDKYFDEVILLKKVTPCSFL